MCDRYSGVAIEETDLSGGAVDEQADGTATSAGVRYSDADFRLQLNSPLFHRDPGMATAGQASLIRQLTWEHVVRPTAPQELTDAGENATVVAGLSPVGCERISPFHASVEPPPSQAPVDEPSPRFKLPTLTSLSTPQSTHVAAAPPVDVSPAEPPTSVADQELPPVDAPVEHSDAVDWAALSVITEAAPPAAPYVQPGIGSLLAALEQMDAAEADHVPMAEVEEYVVPAHGIRDLERLDARSAELLGQLDVLDPGDPAVGNKPSVAQPEPTPSRPTSSAYHRVTSASAEQAAAQGTQPVPRSGVEAELNRLAFLPDREDEVGPVKVPSIASSQQSAPAGAVVALSQHEMYAPRQAPIVHSRSGYADLANNTFTPQPRKRKRGVLRRGFGVLIALALVGGGLFAAKYYLLDKQWEGAAKELAADVETARNLFFDHAVTVTVLPADDYATKIATLALVDNEAGTEALAGEWRSLGLLSGALDLRSIGIAATPDSPAYYDPGNETIYVLEGLEPALYRFAMHRALTVALLDQHYGWGGRARGASQSVAHGTRALFDADALATATALTDDAARTEVFKQVLGLYARVESSPSPFAAAVTGRLGVALMPYLQSLPITGRDGVLKDRTISDGQALDIRRLVPGGNEVSSESARGMLFWYHVLAARIDTDSAWLASMAWRDDDMSAVSGISGMCVLATIRVDLASLDSAARAFQAWAAAAPAEARTTVTPSATATDGQISISACDPGVAVPTNDGRARLTLGGAPLRAEQFRLLVAQQPTLPVAQLACAVFGGDDVVVADDRGVIDATNVWPAPAAHPAADPNRLGCVPTA